ncbi:MAG: class I SAM-dependent methyltransferase [Candidatus Rokubacteria bacterium]|nr:class I SAM-dependent methyltransferase [Candidatus Rokubacteria bacterium]
MAVTPAFVRRLTRKWMDHAPHLWWGDRLDARFVVADRLAALTGRRVLDVGCNAGVMLSELGAGSAAIGLDLSAQALELARKLVPSVPLVQGDMLALPFADGAFDAVIFCGMLEVPPHDRKSAAVAELARVLRRGGVAYITTPNRAHLRYRGNRRMLSVTYEELQTLLRPHFAAPIRGFDPFPPFPWFLPNRVLARIPGIWRLLDVLMRRGFGTRASCMFIVEAVRC